MDYMLQKLISRLSHQNIFTDIPLLTIFKVY